MTYTIFESNESSGVTYDLLYDELGNIISDDENTYIYELDKLVAIQNNSKNITYEYGCNGFRTYKKVLNTDGTYQETYYNESENKIIKETRYDSSTNTTTYIIYIYDESGVAGFKTGTDIDDLTTYYYVKNLQNDVIQIIDINSNVVVEYTYDAYGNVFVSGTLSNTIGKLNPYRYRGYYYDEETSLFWLSSRYYSPELCRFISPDDIEYLDPESVNGLNLYCYCMNNPIMYSDPSGHIVISTLIVGAIIGFVVGGATSAITQGLDKGWDNINCWQVLLDATIGGISGALGASGISQVVSMIAGGVLGAAGSIGGDLIASGGDWSQVNVGKAILMGAIGVGLGRWAGAGTQNSKAMVSTINAGKSWGSKAFLTSAKEVALRPNSGLTLQTMYTNMAKAINKYTIQGISKVSSGILLSTALGNSIGW